MFAVTFRIFSLYNHGAKKGKPNPESFHTLTLYRDPNKFESVGDTLKRAKGMISEGTRVVILNPGMETDAERLRRYEREGKEIVVTKSKDAVEAGDTTMVADVVPKDVTASAFTETLRNHKAGDLSPITITPSEAPAMADAVAA